MGLNYVRMILQKQIIRKFRFSLSCFNLSTKCHPDPEVITSQTDEKNTIAKIFELKLSTSRTETIVWTDSEIKEDFLIYLNLDFE